jgi:hypothetical protein
MATWPKRLSLTRASNRLALLTPCKHNGQRWRALAVRHYESRALPLSYGGRRIKLAVRAGTRYYNVALDLRPIRRMRRMLLAAGERCAW